MGLYSKLLEKTLLPVVLRRDNRLSALRHYRFFRSSQYWPRQRVLDYQWEKLKRLLAHAYTTCPYYRSVFDERGLTPDSFRAPDDLSRLPILTRSDVFEHLDDLISTKFERSTLHRYSTGGTTGQQAPLFVDQESFNVKLGAAWRFEKWMGQFPCDRTALVWPAAMDIVEHESLRERVKRKFILRHETYHAGSMTDEVMRRYHAAMLRFKPKFLRVFPSVFYGFVQYIEQHGLKIPKLRGVMSTGEVLYDYQRQKFESLLGCPVFDLYASREVGNTACECRAHDGLHVSMETQFVEIVSDSGPVALGEEGLLVVTDLTNYGMPLIRYKINDYGVALPGDCICGRALQRIGSTVGRIHDYVWGPDGTMHSGNVFGLHLTAGEDGIEIGQTQFIQKSLKHFHVRITDQPKPTPKVIKYLKTKIREIISEEVEVTVEVVSRIPQEKSGKTRFVICEIDPPTGKHPAGQPAGDPRTGH